MHEVLADDQSGGENAAPEGGEVALVAVGDHFDQSMGTQALENVGGAPGGEALDVCTKIAGAQCGDGPLAACEGQKESVVRLKEEVETAEGSTVMFRRGGDLGDGLVARVGSPIRRKALSAIAKAMPSLRSC